MPAFTSIQFSLPVIFSEYAAGFQDYLRNRYGANDVNAVVLAGPANIAKKRYWLVLFKAGDRPLELRVVVGKISEDGALIVKRVMPAKVELVYHLFGAAAAETVYQFMSWRRNQNHNDWS